MPAKKAPEDIKTRIAVSLSIDDIKRFDAFLDHLKQLCEANGAKPSDISTYTTRSGFLTAAIQLLGVPEYQKALDGAVCLFLGLNVSQTKLDI
jgi:hypothetical protein